MSNKLFGDNVKDYLVDGAKDKGYLKGSGKGFGDGPTSTPDKSYSRGYLSPEGFFEGKKGSKGVGGIGAKGV